MPGYGRLVEHDERSRMFAAARAPVQRSVLHGHEAPVLDQGTSNSCTGHALAQCINTDVYAKCRRAFLGSEQAWDLYALATRLDSFPGSYPPEDKGSSGLAVAKAGFRRGYVGKYAHAFGFDNFCRVLQTLPVLVGTKWFKGMDEPDAAGFVAPSGEDMGGHEYLALGIDYGDRSLTFLNSWGADWGVGGRFKMRFEVFASLLAQRGDVVVPVPLKR